MLNVNPYLVNSPQYKPYDMQNPALNTAATVPVNSQQIYMPNVTPTYNVNVPSTYSKTSEINLPYDLKAHCYKLANGQKVIIVPKEGETVLKTYVNSGSMNEPDKVRGISHYIEHNLFNGSNGLEEGDFFKVVDQMGASTNAATGFAETNYYISSNLLGKDDFEKQLGIHASMIETPLFKDEKLEKEKGIVNSEINMILSRSENIGVNKTLKNLYNVQSTSVDLIGGTTDNITNLTREDVVDYYNKNYYPSNMTTVITGEVDPEQTMQLVSKYFKSTKQAPAQTHHEQLQPIQKPVREDIISNKATATSIIMGFNGPQNNNSIEQIHFDALARVLANSSTSRIDNKLKELNTGAWIEREKISTKPTDNYAILLSADTTEENSEKVLKTIYNEIHKIQHEPPTDEEMLIVKKSMLKDFSNIFESSFSINNTIGSNILDNTMDSINNFENILNSMTAQDLANAAKKYLDLNKTALTVVHPPRASEQTINANYANAVSFTGSNTAHSKRALNMDKVTEYKAANNIKLLTHDISTRNSYIDIEFNCDNVLKTKPATSFILNKMLKEGSAFRNQTDFDKNLQKNGISTGLYAGSRYFGATSSFDVNDMDEALKTIREVLQNPRFTDDTLIQVKNDLREAILMSEKSAFANLECEIFKGKPSGYSNKEVLESIDAVTMDDVKELYNYILANSQAMVTISAPFSKQPQAKNILFNEIMQYQPVKEFKPVYYDTFKQVEQTKVITEADNKNQASIVQAYKFKINQNLKDAITFDLLNKILGGGASSRLFNDLREEQKLAYSVRSGLLIDDNESVFAMSIGTTTENNETGETSYDNVQKSINGFNKHVNKLLTEKVTDEELRNAKLSIKNEALSASETNSVKNSMLSSAAYSFYGNDYHNQYLEMIDQITADDIYNAAQYIFSNKPTYSIVATENTLKHNDDFFKSLEK